MDAQRSYNAIGWRQNVNRLFSFVFRDVLCDIEDILLNLVDGLLCFVVEGGKGGLRLNKSALRPQVILLRHSLSAKDFEIDRVLRLEGTVRDDVISVGLGELIAFSLQAPQGFFVTRDLLRKLYMLGLLIEDLRLKGFLLRARHDFTQIALLLQQGLLLLEALNRPPDCRSGDGIGFTIYDKEELTLFDLLA